MAQVEEKCDTIRMLGHKIASHYFALIYEIRSHATQFRFCM